VQTLDVGEVANLVSTWWHADRTPAEPSDITLTVTAPDGTVETYDKASLTPGSSGAGATQDRWSHAELVDQAGVWQYVFVGTVDGDTVTQPTQVFLVGAGTAETSGPCEPWCTWEDLTGCGGPVDAFDALPEAQREVILDQASQILYDLTRRTYSGICTTTRSLCLMCGSCWPSGFPFVLFPSYSLSAGCGCEPRASIDLGPLTPVWGAYDVWADGEQLPPGSYRITGRRYLTRTDGSDWPRYTDITDPTAFRATWVYGRPVPDAGRRAAAIFANEIAKQCVGSSACALPQRVTTIVREGVTYTVLDSMKMIEEGRTGLPLVDLWVVADGQGRKMRPGMFSPGAVGVSSPRKMPP